MFRVRRTPRGQGKREAAGGGNHNLRRHHAHQRAEVAAHGERLPAGPAKSVVARLAKVTRLPDVRVIRCESLSLS